MFGLNMWLVASQKMVSPCRFSQSLLLLARSSATLAPSSKNAKNNKKEPSSLEESKHNNKQVTVMMTSASLPPLVRSMLLKAVSILSKQPFSKSDNKNNGQRNNDVREDPVSSLFLRFGSAKQADNHGLDFLVDVKKADAVPKMENCVLEPQSTRIPSSLNEKLPLLQRAEIYLALGKARLSALVVLTTAFGYGLCLPASSSVAAMSPLLHLTTFTLTTIGTTFLALGANTLNQFSEAPYDSQMPRTRNRPLAVRALSPEHALVVGILSSLTGAATLALTTNPTTTALGVANCLLYAAVYTPMKRTSSYNTWVGAIVGTLPPLMGWSAATGGHLDPAAYILACILFSWQFPHFMALSWNMRGEYARAGYQVQAVVNANACRQAALRHSTVLTGLCLVAVPVTNLAPWSFAFLSLPINGYLLYLSRDFRHRPNAASARKLFLFSLVYLPALLTVLAATSYLGR